MAFRRRRTTRRKRRRSRRPYRTSRRFRRRRRLRRRSNGNRISLRRTLLPRNAYVAFRYIDSFNMPLTDTSPNYRLYRLNNPYDPLHQLGGRQPPGWDQFSLLYRQYTCYKTFYKITFVVEPNQDAAVSTDTFAAYGNRHLLVGTNVVSAEDNSPILSDYRDHLANPNTRYMQINGVPGNRSMVSMKGWINHSRFHKRNVFTDPNFTSVVSSGPLRETIHFIWARNPGASLLDGTNLRIRVILSYKFYVLLKNPISLHDAVFNNEDPTEVDTNADAEQTTADVYTDPYVPEIEVSQPTP